MKNGVVLVMALILILAVASPAYSRDDKYILPIKAAFRI